MDFEEKYNKICSNLEHSKLNIGDDGFLYFEVKDNLEKATNELLKIFDFEYVETKSTLNISSSNISILVDIIGIDEINFSNVKTYKHLSEVDDKIDVVVHPQSIIHSAVEFKDGSTLAQIGYPSMHIPIQYALTHPTRLKGIESKNFNFVGQTLTFEKPDFEKFPCLELAFEAGKIGGTMPVVLNASNEVAVSLLLEEKIKIGNSQTCRKNL